MNTAKIEREFKCKMDVPRASITHNAIHRIEVFGPVGRRRRAERAMSSVIKRNVAFGFGVAMLAVSFLWFVSGMKDWPAWMVASFGWFAAAIAWDEAKGTK